MAKPKVAQVQARYETDLEAADIEVVIDAAYQEITDEYGADDSQVDILRGGHRDIYMSRKALTISSVVETIGATDTTLSADDYEISQSSWALKRLDTGTNKRSTWGAEVTITYTPVANAQRIEACIKLVILSLEYSGTQSDKVGDVSKTALPDYHAQRRAILKTLAGSRMGFA